MVVLPQSVAMMVRTSRVTMSEPVSRADEPPPHEELDSARKMPPYNAAQRAITAHAVAALDMNWSFS